MQARITPFFHEPTSTWSYLVHEPASGTAAVIDPVLDFDPLNGTASPASARKLLDAIDQAGARLAWVLETHAHADHLSAAAWLRRRTGAKIGIGAGIVQVQRTFKQKLALSDEEFAADGRQFDCLLDEGDELALGAVPIRVVATPGHTADSVSYVIGDAAFIGDTLFSPGAGTARCDFPGGDARALYASIGRILALPVRRLFLAHDYPPPGQAPVAEVTVAAQRAGNIHVREGIGLDEFVRLRRQRDATLPPPRLLWPALQANIRAGELPAPAANGERYFRLPVRLVEDDAGPQ
jgi:glyoxylase-like metal-dependent hydrolase (beta-lactamase superfamily II)